MNGGPSLSALMGRLLLVDAIAEREGISRSDAARRAVKQDIERRLAEVA